MKNYDNCSVSLMTGIKALMNQSSGTIEEISREALQAIAAFIQDQSMASDCGGLNTARGFGAGAESEYQDCFDFRKSFDYDLKLVKNVEVFEDVDLEIVLDKIKSEYSEEELAILNEELGL